LCGRRHDRWVCRAAAMRVFQLSAEQKTSQRIRLAFVTEIGHDVRHGFRSTSCARARQLKNRGLRALSLLVPQTASTYSRHALSDGLPMTYRMPPNDYNDYRDYSGAVHGQINSNLGSGKGQGTPERSNRPCARRRSADDYSARPQGRRRSVGGRMGTEDGTQG
jgi:hypothetical protein